MSKAPEKNNPLPPQDKETTLEENDDLYEHFKIQADAGQTLLRIDKFLTNRLPKVSRNRIQQAAKANCLLVNGQAVKSNYKVRPLDLVQLVLPQPPQNFELQAEPMDLDIVYEDKSLLVLQKPAGMVVHPGHGNYTGTLVQGLLHHFEQLPVSERGIDAKQRPGLVHRLDKNTTGLMVIAKTEYTMTFLAKQFFDRTVQRSYLALVWGDVAANEGTIQGNIGRSVKDRRLRTVYEDGNEGKHAVTHYKVIERFGYVTLVECRLETGRTHQIRVHFKHIGHTLFNDPEYGGNRILKGTIYSKYRQFVQNCFKLCPRQALHAKELGFTHPTTGENCHFYQAPPADMEAVLQKWRRYTGSGGTNFDSE